MTEQTAIIVGEDFESDVGLLISAVRAILSGPWNEPPTDEHRSNLEEALANVEAWYGDDDPRSMGWVNDKGQP